MTRKLTNEDILRIAYKKYKQLLSETKKKKAASVQKEATPQEPIDFHPSYYKGKYYFNVSVTDKSMFNSLANFGTNMAGMAMRAAEQNGVPFNEKNFRNIKNMFRVSSSNDTIDENTEWMILKVPIDRPEELLDENGKPNFNSPDIKKIFNVFVGLKQLGVNVTEDEMRHAFNTMFHYVANKPDKENEKQVEKEIQELFFKICQTIGEDETQKLLGTIQITEEGYIADHQYSLHNKLRIIAQAILYDKRDGGDQVNTISYLATPRQWRKMGRQVVDFSHPYHTVTFNGGRGSQEREIEFAARQGMAPLRVNEGVKNRVGFAAGKGLNAAVNAEMYGRGSFSYNDAVYDVQATQVLVGMQDKFSTEPGMINNLTGEFNDVAKEKLGILDKATNDEKAERTAKLNDKFNTHNYEGVNLTYNAVCQVAGVKESLPADADVIAKIKETGKIIDQMLIDKLRGFKDGEGHIARPENYLPLVPVGRIIIQSIIGLPMDDAPAIQWTEKHRQITNALSTLVHSISNQILRAKAEIQFKQNGKQQNLDETIQNFSPLFIFEEYFNNALNILIDDARN